MIKSLQLVSVSFSFRKVLTTSSRCNYFVWVLYNKPAEFPFKIYIILTLIVFKYDGDAIHP